jgi:hypothetical protein
MHGTVDNLVELRQAEHFNERPSKSASMLQDRRLPPTKTN